MYPRPTQHRPITCQGREDPSTERELSALSGRHKGEQAQATADPTSHPLGWLREGSKQQKLGVGEDAGSRERGRCRGDATWSRRCGGPRSTPSKEPAKIPV